MLSEKEKLNKLNNLGIELNQIRDLGILMERVLKDARVYKEAWDESEVLSTIEKESGRQFDPELVEIFFSRLNILRAIQERYKG